jgi:hypothetical protein
MICFHHEINSYHEFGPRSYHRCRPSRVFGSTLALQTYPAYHSFFHQLSHSWPSTSSWLQVLSTSFLPLLLRLSLPLAVSGHQ